MASEGLHEPAALLDEATINRHRAFVWLKEELQATDCAGRDAVEDDAKPPLGHLPGGRKLVDFHGPAGWHHSAALGRVTAIDGPAEGRWGSRRASHSGSSSPMRRWY